MGEELAALLERARHHVMSPEERAAQRESWIRAFAPCEHGDYDWETCPDCLAKYLPKGD